MSTFKPITKSIRYGAVVLALALANPAMAAGSDTTDPRQQLEQSVEGVLDALRLMLRMIPTYDMPEVLPNGDILIRRRHSEDEEAPQPDGPQDDHIKT